MNNTEFGGHLWLKYRNTGDCRRLCGNVAITTVLVDDPNGSWTDAAIARLKYEYNRVTASFEAEARSYGAHLSVTHSFLRCRMSSAITWDNCGTWKDEALAALGYDKDSMIPSLKKKYGSDEAPVMFFMNYDSRAFASASSGSSGFEYGVLYDDDYDYRHELCHIYGARDFYYPAEVKALADTHLPNSVMDDSNTGRVDDLTAYMIGWTDTLTPAARAMLRDTFSFDQSFYEEAKKKETVTGFGIKHYSDSVYMGDLVFGMPHGRGSKKWNNGCHYDGEWENGFRNGQGKMKYADGGMYSGTFVNGLRCGHGVCLFPGGGSYDGEWKDDKYHGYGVARYSGGSVYKGNFETSRRHGFGIMTYADGTVYEGYWKNDKMSGRGKYRYSNGDVHDGEWENGQRHGQGVYTFKDGSVKKGVWKNDKYVREQGGGNTTPVSKPGKPEVQHYQGIPKELRGHVFLDSRYAGSCGDLTGDVLLTVILVDDDGGSWTDADVEECKRIQMEAAKRMLSESMEYGAKLKLFISHQRCRVSGKVSIHDYADWAERIRIAAGYTGAGSISDQVKAARGVKEAPVLFCVNYHNGRSFAIQHTEEDYFEYTVLFKGEWEFRHEVYHLFGAKDLYYPTEISDAAGKYLADSVMLDPWKGKVDSLTAYLVGWTDRLAPEAERFLRETAYITKEYLREKHRRMIFTGKGTLEYSNGKYEGDVVGGCPQGHGVYVWNSGDSYEGEWAQGQMHGYGVYTAANGGVLRGRWENGKFMD